jgi:hypothetical protein
MFPSVGSLGERKAHTVKGSQKAWPLGVLESEPSDAVVLVEGGPDFLAAHYLILWECAPDYRTRPARIAPVAMLSASCAVHEEALGYFAGKHVRIFPHADANAAGLEGARKWQSQLMDAGARHVDIFDLTHVAKLTGGQVKDLNDFLALESPALFSAHPELFNTMPKGKL